MSLSGRVVGLALVALVSAITVAGCGTGAKRTAVAPRPLSIKIGTLYAESGGFALSSQSQYAGLRFWANQINSKGGVYVKAYHRRLPVRIVAYNDKSDPFKAQVLYSQLIARDHVNVVVADYGPELTDPAVTVTNENGMVLFDPTGDLSRFFANNPYIVATGLPAVQSPDSLADFLRLQNKSRIAIIYTNSALGILQDNLLITQLRSKQIRPVSNQSVSRSTRNYRPAISDLVAAHPDAVIEFGRPSNDAAFLRSLASSGLHFPMVFTSFTGRNLGAFERRVGVKSLVYTFTYRGVDFGMQMPTLLSTMHTAKGATVNFLDVAGYNTGLVIQKTLETAKSLTQMDLRKAAGDISMVTLEGAYKINSCGEQIGDQPVLVAQLQPRGSNVIPVIVYPSAVATGRIVPVPSQE